MDTISLISLILASVFALSAVIILLLRILKYGYRGSTFLYLGFSFLALLTIYLRLTFTNGSSGFNDGITKVFTAFADSLAAFTLRVNSDAIALDPTNGVLSVSIYLFTVFAFAFTLYTFLLILYRSFFIKFKAFFSFLKTRTRHVIFSDRSAPEIIEFVSAMRNKNVIVVLSHASQATQVGTELNAALSGALVNVIVARNSTKFLKHLISFCKTTIFYSFYNEDIENIKFATTVLDILSSDEHLRTDTIKNPNRFITYVHYENTASEEHLEIENQSKGIIRAFNDCEWISTSFLFKNPVSLFVPVNAFDKKNQLSVHYIGFERLGSALLKRMVPAYQCVEPSAVQYHVYDKNASEIIRNLTKPLDLDSVDAQFPTFPLKYIFSHDVDIMCDADLLTTLTKTLKKNMKHIFIIAQRGSVNNFEISIRLKSLLRLTGIPYSDVVLFPFITNESFGTYKELTFQKRRTIDSNKKKGKLEIPQSVPLKSPFLSSVEDIRNGVLKDYPMVAFGRGGHFYNESIGPERYLVQLAKNMNAFYNTPIDYNLIKDSYNDIPHGFKKYERNASISRAASAFTSKIYSMDPLNAKRIFDNSEKEWGKLSYAKKCSNFSAAISLVNKLHYLGYELELAENVDQKIINEENDAISKEIDELIRKDSSETRAIIHDLACIEHNRWSAQTLLARYRHFKKGSTYPTLTYYNGYGYSFTTRSDFSLEHICLTTNAGLSDVAQYYLNNYKNFKKESGSDISLNEYVFLIDRLVLIYDLFVLAPRIALFNSPYRLKRILKKK